ncbi:MAG: hypothetical protein JXR41_01605 [Bacteroidales bacterium]|nr:hypothetical protein [Bacteroidales bacterium]MBN2761755.1 hypothetical protein [Bacteroidales bacterium]
MKSKIKHKLTIALAIGMPVISLFSQNEIFFNPAELIPHEDGYYIAGVNLDLDQDGNLEFYSGCFDAYENFLSPQDNHHESGTQQNFTYINCMIMPTCTHKGTPIEPPVPDGYIQMAPSLYLGTDSASISAIISPAIMNLQSLFMETSADVSINDQRMIPYNIEYSKDNGLTWEITYIQDYVEAQGGYRVTYDSQSHLEFEEMINASKTDPVVIRISTNDVNIERPLKGQYVKIHSMKLTADIASSITDVKVDDCLSDLMVKNRTLSARHPVKVYDIMGRYVNSGQTIEFPSEGIYIVFLTNGKSKKLLVK